MLNLAGVGGADQRYSRRKSVGGLGFKGRVCSGRSILPTRVNICFPIASATSPHALFNSNQYHRFVHCSELDKILTQTAQGAADILAERPLFKGRICAVCLRADICWLIVSMPL